MRIALLALDFTEYASRLALALSAQHEVLLVLRSSDARTALSDELRAHLARTVTVREVELPDLRRPGLLGGVLAVNRLVWEFSPDVVHVEESHPTHVGWSLVAFSGRVPIVLEVHDPVPHSGETSKNGWQRKIVQWFRRKATRIVVHGPRMLAEIRDLDKTLLDRSEAIPLGVLGRSRVDEDISGYEAGALLFFGRIESHKGLRYLLDAGDLLYSRGLEFRLIVAGTGRDLEQHRERIAATPWVELIDRYVAVAEVPALFRRASGVVLPYTDATHSSVSVMACAASRPVVATSVGGLPEVVIDGQTGLLVPPRNVVALADALEGLLTDPGLRDALAAGAGQFARDKLAWPHIADLLHGTYRRAIDDHIAASIERERDAA
jgi:glycogen(starch) synthase